MPNNYEYALMACDVYIKFDSSNPTDNLPVLNWEWKLCEDIKGKPLTYDDGYLSFKASAYCNSIDKQVVVAYRGTVGLGNWLHDNINLLFGLDPGSIGPADLFLTLVHTTYPNYKVYITGHSLGAAIGEIVAWRNDFVEAATTFESPGSKYYTVDRISNPANGNLKIYTYLTTPNLINTLGAHTAIHFNGGKLYRLHIPHNSNDWSELSHIANCFSKMFLRCTFLWNRISAIPIVTDKLLLPMSIIFDTIFFLIDSTAHHSMYGIFLCFNKNGEVRDSRYKKIASDWPISNALDAHRVPEKILNFVTELIPSFSCPGIFTIYSENYVRESRIHRMSKYNVEGVMITWNIDIGPDHVPGFSLRSFKKNENSFYKAVVDQMEGIQYKFIEEAHGGKLHESLKNKMRDKGTNINLKNKPEQFIEAFPDLILAIVDSRHFLEGKLQFSCYYKKHGQIYKTNHNADTLPNRGIIRIVDTGDQFLSIRNHGSLTKGSIRTPWNYIETKKMTSTIIPKAIQSHITYVLLSKKKIDSPIYNSLAEDCFNFGINEVTSFRQKNEYDNVIIGTHTKTGYVMFGTIKNQRHSLNLSHLSLISDFSFTETIASVSSAGDFNKDGYYDIVATMEGKAYVIFGRKNNADKVALSNITQKMGFSIKGDMPGRSFDNRAIGNAGDVNGDGYDDIIIGTRDFSYVIFGKKDNFSNIVLSNITKEIGFLIIGNKEDGSSFSVNGIGDINKDGYADIIIVASTTNTTKLSKNEEIIYVIFGKKDSSDIDLVNMTLKQGFKIESINIFDNSSYLVGGAGDINKDSYDDIIIKTRNSIGYLIFGKKDDFSNIDLSNLTIDQGFAIANKGENLQLIDGICNVNKDNLLADIVIGLTGVNSDSSSYTVYGDPSPYSNLFCNSC